jgi:Polysaccharide deacetylase
MNFLFTIDTEVYPINPDWRSDMLARDVQRDLYGKTAHGAFGVGYQIEVFARYGIKAVFFVEGLHASCPEVGMGPLTKLVELIQSSGHEVQLHLHPEWVPLSRGLFVPDRGYLLTSYSQDEQLELIQTAAANLVKAGAQQPTAFRAGDYAANLDTLKALVRLGFRFDTSYNYPYLGSTCGITSDSILWQPASIEGLLEVPVSCYQDRPGHYRHCQLGACSLGEIAATLASAQLNAWETYVLVSHSFELINNRWAGRPVGPRRRVVRRFENLCQRLASLASSASVRTCGFRDLEPLSLQESAPIKGNLAHYALRNVEQAIEVIRARLA